MTLEPTLLILHSLTIVFVLGTLIIENRNPLKAATWVFIVSFLPVLGLILYIVFGQDIRKRHRISRRFYKRLIRMPQSLAIPEHIRRKGRFSEARRHLMSLIERFDDCPPLALREIETFISGETLYNRMWDDLRQATSSIHLECYIFENDSVMETLSSILIQKARSGVRVRLIYDHLGSYEVPKHRWKELQAAGIEVYAFMRVRFALLSNSINYRNHRKIVVIDGSIGYAGGMNFAQRYAQGDAMGAWRDTHFRLEGLAVSSLQSIFLQDWYSVSRRVVNLDQCFPQIGHHEHTDSTKLVQFIAGGPLSRWRSIEQTLVYAIAQARHSVRIQTPYFLPTENLNTAIINAALSGIRVELIVPARSDSSFTQSASNSYLTSLLEAGVRIFRYRAGFLHSKLLLIDEEVSVIGSTNMDFRSLEHNFELCGFVYDRSLAQHLSAIYDQDIRQTEEINYQGWVQRPSYRRFIESFARLFSPLL